MLSLLTPILLAAGGGGGTGGSDTQITITPGSSVANIDSFTVSNIISWAITMVLVLAGVIFFFMLVIGGIRWIISDGDKVNTEGARNQITAALIGLIIVFASWAIINLISTVFGIDITNFSIPTILPS